MSAGFVPRPSFNSHQDWGNTLRKINGKDDPAHCQKGVFSPQLHYPFAEANLLVHVC